MRTGSIHLASRMRQALANANKSRKKKLAERWKQFRRAEDRYLRNTKDKQSKDAYQFQKKMLRVWLDAMTHLPENASDATPIKEILKKWR